VDGSGQLLRKAVGARPFLVKPNRDEAEALTGVPIADLESAVAAARSLVGGGVGIAIVSLGARGAVAADAERAVHAWTERVEAKNTVGSGDCLLGGLAVALARGEGLHEMLRLGVACGTANALSPETGIARRDDIDTLRPRVQIKEL
jgi:tagatose 6-phosphate kinase